MYNAIMHYYLLSVTAFGCELSFEVIGWRIVNYHLVLSFLICISGAPKGTRILTERFLKPLPLPDWDIGANLVSQVEFESTLDGF